MLKMNQKKNNHNPIRIALVMLGMFVIPASVFAVQSGNGFFVHDQVNSIAGASSGNGISNQSGGSPLSSQSMSGGGFILFGGAYRGVFPQGLPLCRSCPNRQRLPNHSKCKSGNL